MSQITVKKKSCIQGQIERLMIFSCCVKLVCLLSAKNLYHTYNTVTISAAKHQHSDKSLKIKFKAVEALE